MHQNVLSGEANIGKSALSDHYIFWLDLSATPQTVVQVAQIFSLFGLIKRHLLKRRFSHLFQVRFSQHPFVKNRQLPVHGLLR